MSHPITWILVATLPQGQRPALEELMHEMCEATRANEPGCLMYDWFISANEAEVHILESYADEAAVIAHIGTFNTQYARRLFGILGPKSLTVYGTPSVPVLKALAPLRPVVLMPL